MSAKHFLSGIYERKLHGYSGIVLNKFTELCNLAIPCHLYYAILRTILSSFLVFLIKSLASILMYKIQFVRLLMFLSRIQEQIALIMICLFLA